MFIRFITATILYLLSSALTHAQTNWPNPEVESAYKNAKEQLTNGRFDNAILGYQQVLASVPESIEANAELARAFLLSGKNKQAYQQVERFIERGTANDQMYQVAASAIAKEGKTKQAGELFEKGLEKQPGSGYLYYEYGKYLISKRKAEEALRTWIKGITMDPEYYHNYYEAAYAYFFSIEPMWSILYSEIFLNTEHLTLRSKDVRIMMLNSIKNFYKDNQATRQIAEGSATNFYDAVKDSWLRHSGLIADGYTLENLTMLRIRIGMYWKQHYAQKFPYSLFNHHQLLISEGQFDAYNQYLLGEAVDKNVHQAWLKMHPKSIEELKEWLKKNPLRMTPADAYNKGKVERIFTTRNVKSIK